LHEEGEGRFILLAAPFLWLGQRESKCLACLFGHGATAGGYNALGTIAKLSALLVAGKFGARPPMQQIADWLNSLGLGQYARRFAENDIDVSVLRYLTDADLEKIGVSLGHRRKMLAAISGLASVASATSEPTVGQEPKTQDAAERRQGRVSWPPRRRHHLPQLRPSASAVISR
jgi:hypothetical protein